jgi:hypothetical protein
MATLTTEQIETYLADYEILCREIKDLNKKLELKKIFIRQNDLFGVFGSMVCNEEERTRESFDLKGAKATLSSFILNKIGHLIRVTKYKQLSVRPLTMPKEECTSIEAEEVA